MKKRRLDYAFVAWQDHAGQQKREQKAAAKLEEAGHHAQAEEEEKRRLKGQIDMLQAFGETAAGRHAAEMADMGKTLENTASRYAREAGDREAEIAGLREKLKETELAKEQLLTDMSQALGLKEEELAALERRRKEDEMALVAAEKVKAEAVAEAVVKKVCSRMSKRLIRSGCCTWKQHTTDQKRLKHAAACVVVRWRLLLLRSRFGAWCQKALEQRCFLRAASKVLNRMRKMSLALALQRWKDIMELRAQEERKQDLTKRVAYRICCRTRSVALHTWRTNAGESARELGADADGAGGAAGACDDGARRQARGDGEDEAVSWIFIAGASKCKWGPHGAGGDVEAATIDAEGGWGCSEDDRGRGGGAAE